MQERLQKILSGAGVCSRRAAEQLIASGAVTVNGTKAQVGDRADIDTDVICVNGKRIAGHESYHTIVLYKPAGVVTTMSDEKIEKRWHSWSRIVRCACCRSADWINTRKECCS